MLVLLFAGLFAALLVACSTIQQPPTPAATIGPTSIDSYDGSWQGNGHAQDGSEVAINFNVKSNVVTSFLFTYTGPNGLRCTSLRFDEIALESHPKILDQEFSASVDSSLSIQGTFESNDSVSGTLSFFETNQALRYGCAANMAVQWTATKQQPITSAQVADPMSSATV